MCGIAGFVGFSDPELINRMNGRLTHRGPDDEGWYRSPIATLGMRRLSIIDLETGHQPIGNEDGAVQVVCNGEIYNFRELRRDLEVRGHRFTTAGDIEVIVHLYEEMGDDCVLLLNGMFAFALWDEKRRRLLMARDRFGIKPLSYLRHRDRLLFASEIKALLAYPEYQPEPNPRAIQRYLACLYTPGTESAFEGIEKLAPGHRLVWENGKTTIDRYWDLEFRPERMSRGEQREGVRHLLDEAVRRQLVSDVPFGAFLSGGLDSTGVVASMSRHCSEPIRTYAIGYGDDAPGFNETSFAMDAARAYGTRHTELLARPDVVGLLPRLVWHLDEPFANPSVLPAFLIAERARVDVKMALSGAGGDEVFGGYPRYLATRMGEAVAPGLRAMPGFFDSLVDRLPESIEGHHLSRRIRTFWSGRRLTCDERYLRWLDVLGPELRGNLLTSEFATLCKDDDPLDAFRDSLVGAPADPLDRAFYLDFKTWLPSNVLEYTDKMAMMAGLEVRVPFLDNDLVAFALRIPAKDKLRGFRLKSVLRDALRGDVHDTILRRKKMGFMVPVGLWLEGPLRELAYDLLSASRLRERGIVRHETVSWMLSQHFARRRDFSHHLWMLIMLELWFQVFLDPR